MFPGEYDLQGTILHPYLNPSRLRRDEVRGSGLKAAPLIRPAEEPDYRTRKP
jgi:hypothetical protein